MEAISLKFTGSYAIITSENNFSPSEIDLKAECNKFIKGRTVKTLIQEKRKQLKMSNFKCMICLDRGEFEEKKTWVFSPARSLR